MKIKLTKPYGLSVQGAILDVIDPIAELLIGRKIAQKLEENKGRKK